MPYAIHQQHLRLLKFSKNNIHDKNLNTSTRALEGIIDPIPDPTQGSAPGLSFVSNTPAPAGTIFSPTGSAGNGGEGFFIGTVGFREALFLPLLLR